MSTRTHLRDLSYENKHTRVNLQELTYEAHLRDLSSTKTYLQELTYEI